MQRKTKRIIAAVAVVAAVAAGGAAFTASNSIPDSVAGYGTSVVSGADATAIHHNLSADGTHILTTDLTFTGDQTGKTIKAGFGTDALTTCTVGAFAAGSTAVSCDWGANQLTDAANAVAFSVAVTS